MDPMSIIAFVDSALNLIRRVLRIIDNIRNASDDLRELGEKIMQTRIVAEMMRNYLEKKERSLEPSVSEFLKKQARVVKKIIEEIESDIAAYEKDNRPLYTVKYAVFGKSKIEKHMKKLEDWNLVEGDFVRILTALDVIKNTQTLEEICNLNKENLKVLEDIQNITMNIKKIPESLESLSKQMEAAIEVIRVQDKQIVEDNDESLINVTLGSDDLKEYNIKGNFRQKAKLHYKDHNEDHYKDVTVERIPIDKNNPERKTDYRKLAMILRQFRPCHNILEFLGIVEQKNSILFVSDGFLPNLITFIDENHKSISPTPLQRISISYGIACACDYLHTAAVFHRDIRSENIFIKYDPNKEPSYMPYLSGFTHARLFSGVSCHPNRAAFERYVWEAPERAGDAVAEFSAKCDVYSFGVLLLVIGSWRNFDQDHAQEIAESDNCSEWEAADYQRIKNTMADNCKSTVSEMYGDLVKACTDLKARDRPKFEEVKYRLERVENDLEGPSE